MDRYFKFLEVYTIEEILEHLEIEPQELLELLEEQGYEITLEGPL